MQWLLLAIKHPIKTLSAIREVLNLIEFVKDKYDKWKDKQIDDHYENKRKRRERIVKLMELEIAKENPDDKILRDLHYKLNNLDSNIM